MNISRMTANIQNQFIVNLLVNSELTKKYKEYFGINTYSKIKPFTKYIIHERYTTENSHHYVFYFIGKINSKFIFAVLYNGNTISYCYEFNSITILNNNIQMFCPKYTCNYINTDRNEVISNEYSNTDIYLVNIK